MPDAAKMQLTEGTAPATPSAGNLVVYAKTDHEVYVKDPNGNERGLGTSGTAFYAGTAGFATTAANSGSASSATTAANAGSSSFATSAGNSGSASSATTAAQSGTASYATTAGQAGTALGVNAPLTNILNNTQRKAMSGCTLAEATSGAAPVTDGANAALVNNLLTNGGFDSAATSWTAVDCSLSSDAGGKTGNGLTITRTGGDTQSAFQVVASVVGKLYRIGGWVKSGSSGNEAYVIKDAVTNNTLITGTSSGSWVEFSVVYGATQTTFGPQLMKSSATPGTMLFDSVTLYEVCRGYIAADTLGPDGTTKTSTLDWHIMEQDATHGKGYYIDKYTKGANGAEYANLLSITTRADLDQYKGQPVAFGMGGYSVTATDNLKIQIYDGVGTTESAFWGADSLDWKEITRTVSASATELTFRVLLDGDTSDVAYGSFQIAVNGSSIGSNNYAPKPGEEILCQSNITLTGYTATTSAADATINLEAASSGMIGKGVKAVIVKAYGKDSAAGDGVGFDVQSASGVEDGVSVDTQVNNIKVQGNGPVKCDSNGDIYFDHRGSGASALTVDIKVIGVRP